MTSEESPLKLEDILTGADIRRVDSLFDPIRFDSLFEFTNALLASKQIEAPQNPPELSTEARIVASLGMRGLRTAYELISGAEGMDIKEEPVDYAETRKPGSGKRFPIYSDSALEYPEFFSGPLNHQAIQRATQLGEVIMDDMFKILGQDAYVMAEKLKQATDDETQLEVITWLNNRLVAIGETYEDEANSGLLDTLYDNPSALSTGFTFHPARMSGKVIGAYPNHRLSPTCLGISIAAAGFLKRAGMPILHAGVMGTRVSTRIDNAHNLLIHSGEKIKALYDVEFPSKFAQRTEQGAKKLAAGRLADTGYHHCVITQLKSGCWAQVDPNYDATIDIINDAVNQDIDTTFRFLNEMQDIAPGLEVSQRLLAFDSLGSAFENVLESLNPDAIPSTSTIADMLQTTNPLEESLPLKLFEAVAPYAFMPENLSNDKAKRYLMHALYYLEVQSSQNEPILYTLFLGVLENYILDGMQLDEYMKRCQTDTNFRDRAANDLRAAPFMMMLAGTINYLHDEDQYWNIHPVLEVGVAETRIGLAALNDTAQFYDTAPSPHFWLSNWPSIIPATESFYDSTQSEAQKKIVTNNFGLLLKRSLHYDGSYGKILDIQSRLKQEMETEN